MKLTALLLSLLLLTGCGTAVVSPDAPRTPAQSTTVTAAPNITSAAEELTTEQAEAIALEHAGLTADQVTGLRTGYEIDDGIPEYDVEFRVGRTEYDYTIHAETGEILSFDMDD